MTAREFNALLHEHGYLQGTPGNYWLTEKGQEYGSERDHFRGNPGSSAYSNQWTTRTWDERIASTLAADIAAAGSRPTAASAEPVGVEHDHTGNQKEGARGRSPWAVAALVGGSAIAVAGGVIVATNPHVHRWAREKIQPRATKVWRTLTRRPGDDAPSRGVELADAPAEVPPTAGSRASAPGEQLL
jgi:hypothetical protein